MPPLLRKSKFAEALNYYLHASGKSAAWLATRTRTSPSVVSRWLSGETWPRDVASIEAIAAELAVDTGISRQEILQRLISLRYGIDTSGNLASATISQIPNPVPESSRPSVFMVPPLPSHGVWGRDEMLSQIAHSLELLSEKTNVPALALRGMGGIGKTTLAKSVGHLDSVQHFFPDGVFWAELGPRPEIRIVLETWGAAIGLDLLAQKNEESCTALLRSALYEKRALFIIDDLWESNHAGYFRVGGPHSRTLFTTREPPIAYDIATRERTLRVDLLSEDASLRLLESLIPQMVQSDRANALRLCARLEFLPLGLTLAGRLLANEADVPSRMVQLLHDLLEERSGKKSPLGLVQSEERKGIEADQPVSIRAVLGLSVERLSQVDRTRFAIASVFGGAPLYWDISAAAGVWQCSHAEAAITVSNLLKRGLLEHDEGTGRYWMHALLADYALELVATL